MIKKIFLILLFLQSTLIASFFSSMNNSLYLSDSDPVNPNSNVDALGINGKAITIEAWLFPTEFCLSSIKDPTLSSNFYRLVRRPQNYWLSVRRNKETASLDISFVIDHGILEYEMYNVENAIPLNKWTHIAATYDGNYMRIYINGMLLGEKFSAGIIDSSRSNGFSIGLIQGAIISEVRLWNICRNAEEIKATMNTQLSGEEEGLVGYWPLTQADSGSTPDITKNHNDLKIPLYDYDYYNPPYFSNFNFNDDINEGTSYLQVKSNSQDFGIIEKDTRSEAHKLTIINNGNKYVYGKITFKDSTSIREDMLLNFQLYFVDPGDTIEYSVHIVPRIKGEIINAFEFQKGNLNNPGLQVPFTAQCIREEGIDANSIDMWVNKNGNFGYNHLSRKAGLEWPKNSSQFLIYSSGTWIGAKIDNQICTSVASHRSQFAPGNIVDGQPANPEDERFHVYKIHVGDDDSNPDYAEWPTDLGAPVNPDGSPKHMGDQTLFAVYNDLNSNRGQYYSNTYPLGVEIQQTIWGWDSNDELGNSIFLQFKIINRSSDFWEDTYLAIWDDPDVGYYRNDLVGVDTLRNMGFSYNGYTTDEYFSSIPPAVGFKILKGVFYSDPLQSFSYYDYTLPWETYGEPQNGEEFYNYLQGLTRNGKNYVDPSTGETTLFPLNGDPEKNTGWVDSNPGDRRILLSTGPFNLAPGESKEIIAAIIVAQGKNNLNSVTVLKQAADVIQEKFDNGEIMGGAMVNSITQTVPADSQQTINDINNSGAEMQISSGESGATVELASFNGPPTSVNELETSGVHSVGHYLDIQTSGDIEWPVKINIYYTKQELDKAKIKEKDLKGIYYWNSTKQEWILYSNSGADDQNRGQSLTGVDTTNVTIDGIVFEGKVWGEVYHLTPMCIGTEIDSTLLLIHKDLDVVNKTFVLLQNFPNPFNPATTIKYSIAKFEKLELAIYNTLGQKIRTLVNKKQSPGNYSILWDGKDDSGQNVASGIYLCQLKTKDFVKTKKMILIR